MRILHLVQPLPGPDLWFARPRRQSTPPGPMTPPPCELGGVAALAALAHIVHTASADQEHLIALIGAPGPTLAPSADLGLARCEVLSPPLGAPRLAGPAARRLVRSCGPVDAIVAWGTSLRALRPRIDAAAPWFEVDATSSSIAVHGHDHAHAGCRALPHVWATTLTPTTPTTRTGPTSPARPRRTPRSAADPPRVVLLSCPSAPADATIAVDALGVLRVAGAPSLLMLPEGLAFQDRALRRLHPPTYAGSGVVAQLLPRALLADADAALILLDHCRDGEGREHTPALPAGALLSLALSSRVPVVAPRDVWTAAGLVAPSSAADSSQHTALARALLPLLQSAAARRGTLAEQVELLDAAEPALGLAFRVALDELMSVGTHDARPHTLASSHA